MKVVSIKNMFVEDYARWLYDNKQPFLGRELGYSILDK